MLEVLSPTRRYVGVLMRKAIREDDPAVKRAAVLFDQIVMSSPLNVEYAFDAARLAKLVDGGLIASLVPAMISGTRFRRPMARIRDGWITSRTTRRGSWLRSSIQISRSMPYRF
jgi:hypothetical protein